MKAEIKKLWVDALRSGKYKQGRNYLRTEDGSYCCLGVLCELAVSAGVIREPDRNSGGVYVYAGLSKQVLPKSVRRWAGMRNRNGSYGDGFMPLSELNDEGYSFIEIADIIDEHAGVL